MPSTPPKPVPNPLTIAARFKKVYVALMETISPLLERDLLAAVIAGDARQFSHLIRLLGKQTGNHDVWPLADEIDAKGLRWQDWMCLQNAITPPVDPRDVPLVLPRGLGGAYSDLELENVADFYIRHVIGGNLPKKARDLISEVIDRNERRAWVMGADQIAAVTFSRDDRRVIITLQVGREDYVDLALDGSAYDADIPEQDEDDFSEFHD